MRSAQDAQPRELSANPPLGDTSEVLDCRVTQSNNCIVNCIHFVG